MTTNDKFLELIKSHPGISTREIYTGFGVTRKTARRHLRVLKENMEVKCCRLTEDLRVIRWSVVRM